MATREVSFDDEYDEYQEALRERREQLSTFDVGDEVINEKASDVSLGLTVQERFEQLRQEIWKAQREGLETASMEETVQDDLASSPLRLNENSYHLLMSLFGDHDSVEMERQASQRLAQMQQELDQIVSETTHAPKSAKENVSLRFWQENDANDEDFAEDAEPASATGDVSQSDDQTLQKEAQHLRQLSTFLAASSEARTYLEQVQRYVSSPSTMRQAAQALAKADCAHYRAKDLLNTLLSGDVDSTHEDDWWRILDAIAMAASNHRTDLLDRATSTIQSSIQIQPPTPTTVDAIAGGARTGRLVVQCATSTSSAGSYSDLPTDGTEQLLVAFDVLSILGQSEGAEEEPSGQLYTSGASHDLSTLHESSTLAEILGDLASRLYREILQPVLATYEENVSARWRASTSTKSTPSESHVLEWSMNETVAASADKASVYADIWTDVVAFVGSVLTFVHRHVLLQRPAFCRYVGRCLLGAVEPRRSQEESLTIDLLANSGKDTSLLSSHMLRILEDVCTPSSLSVEILRALPTLGERIREESSRFGQLVVKQLRMLSTNAVNRVSETEATTRNDDESESSWELWMATSDLWNNVINYETRYAEKRRGIVLNEGRDIMLSTDFHNTSMVGVDIEEKKRQNHKAADFPYFDEVDDEELNDYDTLSVFALHKSAVSTVALKVMDKCRETLDLAVNPELSPAFPPLMAPVLYRTSRELLDLYRAAVPSSHGYEISTIPRAAAIFHNDCVFFSHTLLTFGLEYRDHFVVVDEQPESQHGGEEAKKTGDSPLRQFCTFVDMVPLFREMAVKTLGDMLEQQKRHLNDIVKSRLSFLAESVRSNEPVAEWTDAETAMAAGVHHLGNLRSAWRPILSHNVYLKSMGHLADTIFTFFLDPTLNANDISVTASRFVSGLFRNAASAVADVLAKSDSTEKLSAVKGQDECMARKNCKVWDRFIAVGRFMDMNLEDVMEGLSGGLFRSVTASELSRLIHATFDDSEKRRAVLQLLASGSSTA